jgi:hypothetical protein
MLFVGVNPSTQIMKILLGWARTKSTQYTLVCNIYFFNFVVLPKLTIINKEIKPNLAIKHI